MKSIVKAVGAFEVEKQIQPLLNDGWIITHCVTEQVAATDSTVRGGMTSGRREFHGMIVFVLTKE